MQAALSWFSDCVCILIFPSSPSVLCCLSRNTAVKFICAVSKPVLLSTVRLCSDRLSLIKDCLAQMSTNYKQPAKLLGLANLLRVAGKLC